MTLPVLLARYANKPRANRNASICSGIRLYIFTYTFQFCELRDKDVVAADLVSGRQEHHETVKGSDTGKRGLTTAGSCLDVYDESRPRNENNQY